MKIEKVEKPSTELFALSNMAIMMGNGTACMAYKGPVDLYLYLINDGTWYKVTNTTKKEKIKPTNKTKDSRNPF